MKLYEFTMEDSHQLSIPQILERAKEAAKEEAEFMFQCSQGTEEWLIEDVYIEGLPVAKDDLIVYHIVVKGKLLKGNYGNQ